MSHDNNVFSFLEKVEHLKSSESFQSYKALRNGRLFLYPIRINFARLLKEFRKFHFLAKESSFWSNETPYSRWKLHNKITTSLFNYITTVVATIELSRRFSKKYLNNHQKELYANTTRDTFINNSEFSMLHELRNYVSHFAFLQPGFIYNYHYQEDVTKGIYLSTTDLLLYDRWTVAQKEYIISLKGSFDIEKLIYDHHGAFLKTQDSMYKFVLENKKEELRNLVTEMEALMEEGTRLRHEFNLPFRRSTIAYIKNLIGDNTENKSHNIGCS